MNYLVIEMTDADGITYAKGFTDYNSAMADANARLLAAGLPSSFVYGDRQVVNKGSVSYSSTDKSFKVILMSEALLV